MNVSREEMSEQTSRKDFLLSCFIIDSLTEVTDVCIAKCMANNLSNSKVMLFNRSESLIKGVHVHHVSA